jgi:Flp pilus assembly protein TadG
MARVLKLTVRVLTSLAVRNCIRNDDGAVLVEAAIVLPVMVLVILGGLDLGLGMLAATRLNFATESAARCLALANPACQDVNAFVEAQSGATDPLTVNVTQTSPSANSVMENVFVSYAYSFIFLPWTVTLQSSASYTQQTQTQPST